MNKLNKHLCSLVAATGAAGFCLADVPEITNVTMSQAADRTVTIAYTLSNAPAVVTVDIQTNAVTEAGTIWASIGGANIQNFSANSAVWKKIAADGNYVITWHPDLSWPNHKIAEGGARAVITAWSMDNTPDYMVVDISSSAAPDSQRYYPSAEFIPGGLFGDDRYRTSAIVMRKIMAKNVTWTMGSSELEPGRTAAREATHTVTLTNNYYIGVFEVTQGQWALIQTSRSKPSFFTYKPAMRPVEQVSYNEVRNAANSATQNDTYLWPNDPNPGSFLGLLRTKTGIDFDLPSECQWEYACRAGKGDCKWNTGTVNDGSDANMPGRCKSNGGYVGGTTAPAATCDPAMNGTAEVGTSGHPNAWGLYDMHGNVIEYCIDWFQENINALNGAPNVSWTYPTMPADAVKVVGIRVARGGSIAHLYSACRSADRQALVPHSQSNFYVGFRLYCRAGLK